MQERKIVLVAETGADIPRPAAERWGIHIVPMHVAFGSETREDGAFPSEEICAYYTRTGQLPLTPSTPPIPPPTFSIWPTPP